MFHERRYYLLKDDDFLALNPKWILINDSKKVLLHILSYDQSEYLIMDPATAIVVSLLDGDKTVKELIGDITYIFDLSSNEAKYFLENVLINLNREKEIVTISNEPIYGTPQYNPLNFMVSPKNFKRNSRPTRPLSLMIFFSNLCQTDCIYCYSDISNMRKLEHLSINQWIPILDQAYDLEIRKIQLCGGDPLGRSDSIKFLVNLLERQFLFTVSTKCYVSLEDAKTLVDSGFNKPINGIIRMFQISVDSSDPGVADYMAGSAGYLKRATESVINLLKADISPKIKAVLTPHNYSQIGDLIDTFASLGVKSFQLTNYGRSPYRHENCLFLTDEMKAKASDLIQEVILEHPELTIEGDATKFEFVPPTRSEEQWKARAGCSGGRTNLGIAPDGKAVLCEQMPFSVPYFVGDLTKQSILDVWNSKEMVEFIYPPKELFSSTPCSDCPDFQECIYDRGYCFRDSLFAFGRLHYPPPNCPRAPEIDYRLV